MSHAEILSELSKLKADERSEVFQRLCELQEEDLLRGLGPTDVEKKSLDEALAEFRRNQNFGRPWREILRKIRSASVL